MNLSSYLQMPPAPLVPTNTSNPVLQSTGAGVGPSTGNSLGFDFADVMARQLQRLVPQQRQTIAADTPEQAEPATNPQDSRPVAEKASEQDTQQARADSNTPEANHDTSVSGQTRQRSKDNTRKTERTDVDTLLAGLMQGAAPATPTPTVSTNASASGVDATATPLSLAPTVAPIATVPSAEQSAVASPELLKTVELSPQVRIITDPKKAPSPESLAAFAKSMGLDESAIQKLLAQQPATPATTLVDATTANATSQPLMPSHSVQAAMGNLLQSVPQNATTPDSAVVTQLTALTTSTADQSVVVSGAGLAAAAAAATTASTLPPLTAPSLPGLTPTDMAAIQQVQITVLPAAVLPVNTPAVSTPMPSTLDMLSLFGSGVSEQDVSALLSRFAEDSGSENTPEQQSSQDGGNHFSSFGQALANTQNPASAASTTAAQATNAHMSEVYDQLSDKMATELAARMHKQLSDGEWKMKFALRPSNLGGVEIQLEMKDGKLDAVFRADNPLTRDLLQNSSLRLKEALGNFGIHAGQVNVGQGGNAQQQSSGNSNRQSQVRDNSSSQVSGTGSVSDTTSTRSKAPESLLDLYA